MDATTATDFITANKGTDILVVLTDASTHYGEALSVNSKGVNIKVDGKVRSFGLKRVDVLELARDNDEADTDDIEAMLHDGMTTAELAAMFGIEPKELRVHLRALGLGVGKGRKYSLSASAYRSVKDLVKANA